MRSDQLCAIIPVGLESICHADPCDVLAQLGRAQSSVASYNHAFLCRHRVLLSCIEAKSLSRFTHCDAVNAVRTNTRGPSSPTSTKFNNLEERILESSPVLLINERFDLAFVLSILWL